MPAAQKIAKGVRRGKACRQRLQGWKADAASPERARAPNRPKPPRDPCAKTGGKDPTVSVHFRLNASFGYESP